MKKRMNKEDRLMSDIMKDFTMEQPPEGFTERVMQNIQLVDQHKVFSSGPLISRAGWIGIAAGLAALVILVLFGSDTGTTAEAGLLAQCLSSIEVPAIHYDFLIRWLDLDSPSLTWVFTGIGGIGILALVERLINTLRTRHFFLL